MTKCPFAAKVLRIQTSVKVARGLTKQEVTVADNTGAIKVTLGMFHRLPT